ncbi:MAG: AcrB/AcrD/AcrF family protein [Alphaproteobacteria bacterium]|nr:AcrB/AcrD/AcrF family protein [Alphaproteobacteria bacterium]
MNALIDAAFSRVRVVLTAMVVLILLGLSAYKSIPREAEPDIPAPFVLVTAPLPGISPEDGERLLVRPTELELQNVEGVEQIDSIAYDGAAQIIVEFKTTIDVDQAVLDVREAVDRAKAEYPDDAEEPTVTEFNTQNQFPILTIILSGDAPERALYRTAQRLKDRLETIGGVLEARLTGARDELIEAIIDPETLESYGLNELEVANAITSNNRLITAGSVDLDDSSFAIKVPGLIKTAEDLMSVPVRSNGEDVVTIGDLGEVRRTFVDRTGYAIFNGEPAIGIEITKRAGFNIVETIEQAKLLVEADAETWPVTVHYAFLGDRSVMVKDNLEGLTSSVMTAVLLVMIVIVAALGLRSAVMVGIAIPTSFLIGFLLLSLFGYTLNMMVMFGLVLAVGMLVDGAIVIIEFADRRMAEGADRTTAYAEASKRMFWPVITSTATTLAAFFPFLFWQDVTGEFMKFLPLTLIFVLTASLVVALIFLPVLGSVFGLPRWAKDALKVKGKTDGATSLDIEEVDPTTLDNLLGRYARLMASLVQRPILVMTAATVVLGLCILSFRIASPDVEYFIRSDNEEVLLIVLARGNMSAQQKIELVEEVAARVEGHPAIESLYLQTGPTFGRSTDIPAEAIGQVGIDLLNYSERQHSRVLVEEFRKLVADVPGALVEVRQREGGPPIGKDVQVEISATSFDRMVAAAKRVREHVETATLPINGVETPVYMDNEDSLPLPGIEWSIEMDRALAGQYGLSVQQAGAMLQLVTDGLLVDRVRPDDADDEIDVRVRYPEKNRNIFALDAVRVQTPNGSVPITNFVQRTAEPQVDRIVRRDGKRVIDVKANANTLFEGREVSQDQAINEMKAWLAETDLGPGVSATLKGADEETAAAAAFFEAAMVASLFMIAMILLLEFNNFYHSALTLTAVIFSVFGVLLGVALSGQYLSIIMTGVGIVALAGIVVNNNIVLIDTFQYLRGRGLSVEVAVIRTATQRLRPVMLTTTTTILGLLPMVFELNVDFAAGVISRGSTTSDWWVLLSSAVVYGLAFSTVLTLVLTPVLLAAPTVIKKRLVGSGGDERRADAFQADATTSARAAE